MHKLCKAGCDNHVCRAFFPEKQPLIDPKSKDICMGDEYVEECLIYGEGNKWREERRLKGLKEKCPFATNTRCGRPWEWWCKGGEYPFQLTTFEVKIGTHDIPVRDENGDIKFIQSVDDFKDACLSGDEAIYLECPNYKSGVALQELVMKLKSEKTEQIV